MKISFTKLGNLRSPKKLSSEQRTNPYLGEMIKFGK